MSKLDDTIEQLKKILKEIFKESPDFTGNIRLNFYRGALASINKSEKIKT